MKIYWNCAVWGEKYVNTFCDYALASHLSPKNLPAIDTREHVYFIYTSHADEKQLLASPNVQKLCQTLTVEINYIEPASQCDGAIDPSNVYALMSQCHEHALSRAAQDGAGCASLVTDALVGDGGLNAVVKRAELGADVILMAGLRADMQAFLPWVDQTCRQSDGRLIVEPRATVSQLRKTCHDYLRHIYIDSPHFSHKIPSTLALPAADDGIVFTILHPHPIYILPRETLNIQTTIDRTDFQEFCRDGKARVETFHESDEFLLIELSSHDKIMSLIDDVRPFNQANVANWISRYAMARDYSFTKDIIRFRGLHGDSGDMALESQANRLTTLLQALQDDLQASTFHLAPLQSPDQINPEKPIFFYGCGTLGCDLVRAMGSAGNWNFQGYVDRRGPGYCGQWPIHAPTELTRLWTPDAQMIITSSYVDEIVRTLQGLGIRSAWDANPWRSSPLAAHTEPKFIICNGPHFSPSPRPTHLS